MKINGDQCREFCVALYFLILFLSCSGKKQVPSLKHWPLSGKCIIPLSPFFTCVLRAVDECFRVRIAALQGYLTMWGACSSVQNVTLSHCDIVTLWPHGFTFLFLKTWFTKNWFYLACFKMQIHFHLTYRNAYLSSTSSEFIFRLNVFIQKGD